MIFLSDPSPIVAWPGYRTPQKNPVKNFLVRSVFLVILLVRAVKKSWGFCTFNFDATTFHITDLNRYTKKDLGVPKKDVNSLASNTYQSGDI